MTHRDPYTPPPPLPIEYILMLKNITYITSSWGKIDRQYEYDRQVSFIFAKSSEVGLLYVKKKKTHFVNGVRGNSGNMFTSIFGYTGKCAHILDCLCCDHKK